MSSVDAPTQPNSPTQLAELHSATNTGTGDSPSANVQAIQPDVAPGRSEGDIFAEQQKKSELVSKAQSFLESPELKESDAKSKAQYLVDKGLPAETIDELQKAISSIPVIPPRTYPEALVSPVRSRLFENIVTLYYFFTYAAGASALLTWVYTKFLFPRWVKMILAKRRLREHQANLMQRLKDNLKAHKDSSLTASSIAPSADSKPVICTRLQELRAQVPDAPPKTTRQHALQSLSDLTGYLSSQIHLSSALDAAARTYQFQFSMPGAAGATKNDIQEQLKKDIRALKGLLINRRTFLQGGSIVPTTSGRPITPAQ